MILISVLFYFYSSPFKHFFLGRTSADEFPQVLFVWESLYPLLNFWSTASLGTVFLVDSFFFLSIFSIPHSLLIWKISVEKSAYSQMWVSLYVTSLFSCWFKNSLLVFGFRQFHYNTSGEDYFDESIGWSASFMNLGFQISPSVQEVLIHYLFKLSLSSSLLLPGLWRCTDCFSKGVPYVS